MQQTDKYKLNIIETSDPFSPAPLNENARTLEAALAAEKTRVDAALAAKAAQTALNTEKAAREAALSALAARVGTLEAG